MMVDEFEGLNPGGRGSDAFTRPVAGRELAIDEPRFPWDERIAERYGDLKVQDEDSWRTLIDAIYPAAKTMRAVVMVLSYCQHRHLDPYKRPVHIVPMYNAALGREVETVWPGIGELRTTAFRTGQYAGMDEPVWGPMVETTFEGEVWGRNRQKVKDEVTLRYPEWCQITVYRKLGDTVTRFVGPRVYWRETYAKLGRSELPNSMWRQRTVGQLEKCAEAAAIRRAFPEETGSEYTSEEMEGQRIGNGDDLIEVKAVEAVNTLSAQEIPAPNGPQKPNGEARTAEMAPELPKEPEAPKAAPDPAGPFPEPIHWVDTIEGMSTKSRHALQRKKITEAQAYEATDEELLAIPNFGKQGLEFLRRFLGQAPRKEPEREPPATSTLDETFEIPPDKPREPTKTIADYFREAMARCTSVEELKSMARADWNDKFKTLRVSKDKADKALADTMYSDYDQALRRLKEAAAQEANPRAEPAQQDTYQPEPADQETEAEAEPEEQEPEEQTRLYNWPDEIELSIANAGSSEQLRGWARDLWDGENFDDVERRYRQMERTDEWANATGSEHAAIIKVRAAAAMRWRV